MFEGWVSDLLASYIGHFFHVSRDQLRISLWSAWRTGVALENVKLRVEALDYLQLPFAIEEGYIGKLQLQIPWQALSARPVVIEVHDLYLCCAPRPEEDWWEDAASTRAAAAKKVHLAASDIASVSQKMAAEKDGNGGGGSASDSTSMWQSFLYHLAAIMINRLQLKVKNVHLRFKDRCCCVGVGLDEVRSEAGGRENSRKSEGGEDAALLTLLSRSPSVHSLPDSSNLQDEPPTIKSKAEKLMKDLVVLGLSLYWDVNVPSESQPPVASSMLPSSSPDDAQIESLLPSLGAPTTIPRDHTHNQHNMHPTTQQMAGGTHYVLHPLKCAIRLSMQVGSASSASSVNVVVAVENVQVAVNQRQLHDMVRVVDCMGLWERRNKYAQFRPAGLTYGGRWRGSWRHVWRYAIRAVLSDVTHQHLSSSLPGRYSRMRTRYIYLYGKRLGEAKKGADSLAKMPAEELLELSSIEDEVSLQDILLLRQLAERAVEYIQQQRKRDEEDALPEPVMRRSWFSGLSGVARYIGYVPSTDATSSVLQPPSESDIQTFYKYINFDPGAAGPEKEIAKAGVVLNINVQVSHSEVCVQQWTPADEVPLDVVVVEVREIGVGVVSGGEGANVAVAVEDFAVNDCFTDGPGVSECMVGRWQTGVVGSVDKPMVRVDMRSGHGAEAEALKVKVVVEPVHVVVRPACLAALIALSSDMPTDIYASRLMDALNCINCRWATTEVKAHMARPHGPPHIEVNVLDVIVVIPDDSSSHPQHQILLCTGAITARTQQPISIAERAKLIQNIKDRRVGRGTVSQFLDSAEQALLYDHVDVVVWGVGAALMAGDRCIKGWPPPLPAKPILNDVRCRIHLATNKLPQDGALAAQVMSVTLPALAVHLTQHQIMEYAGALPKIMEHLAPLLTTSDPTPTSQVRWDELSQVDVRVPSVCLSYMHEGPPDIDVHSLEVELRGHDIRVQSSASTCDARTTVHVTRATLEDKTAFQQHPPPVKGFIPRIMQKVSVGSCSVASWQQYYPPAAMTSIEVTGITAHGYISENKNFILRRFCDSPAVLRVTSWEKDGETAQTSITLQDACIGTGTLSRIIALLSTPSHPAPDLPASSASSIPQTIPQPVSTSPHQQPEGDPAEATRSDPKTTVEVINCSVAIPDGSVVLPDTDTMSQEDMNIPLSVEIPFLVLQLPPEHPGYHPFQHPIENIRGLSVSAFTPDMFTPPPQHTAVQQNILDAKGVCCLMSSFKQSGDNFVDDMIVSVPCAVVSVSGDHRANLPADQAPQDIVSESESFSGFEILYDEPPASDAEAHDRPVAREGSLEVKVDVANFDIMLRPQHLSHIANLAESFVSDMEAVSSKKGKDGTAALQDVDAELQGATSRGVSVSSSLSTHRTSNLGPQPSFSSWSLPDHSDSSYTLSNTVAAPLLEHDHPFKNNVDSSACDTPGKDWRVDVSIGMLSCSVLSTVRNDAAAMQLLWDKVHLGCHGGAGPTTICVHWNKLSLSCSTGAPTPVDFMEEQSFPSFGASPPAEDIVVSSLALSPPPFATSTVWPRSLYNKPAARDLRSTRSLAASRRRSASVASSTTNFLDARETVSSYFSEDEFQDALESLPTSSHMRLVAPLEVLVLKYDEHPLGPAASKGREDGEQFVATILKGDSENTVAVQVSPIVLQAFLHGTDAIQQCLAQYSAAIEVLDLSRFSGGERLSVGEGSNSSPGQHASGSGGQQCVWSVNVTCCAIGVEVWPVSNGDGEAATRLTPFVRLNSALESHVVAGRSTVPFTRVLLPYCMVHMMTSSAEGSTADWGPLLGIKALEFQLHAAQEGDTGGEEVVRVGVDVGRVSVWAAHHRLLALSGLVHHLALAMSHHRPPTSSSTQRTRINKVNTLSVGSSNTPLPCICCHLFINKFVVQLSSLVNDVESPLLELIVSDTAFTADNRINKDSLTLVAKLFAGVNVFNWSHMCWEPVLDPWTLSCRSLIGGLGSSVESAAQGAVAWVKVAADTKLDVTVTESFVDALCAVLSMVQTMEEVAGGVQKLHEVLHHVGSDGAASRKAVNTGVGNCVVSWLVNNSGTQVEYWLDHDNDAAMEGDHLCVASDSTAPIIASAPTSFGKPAVGQPRDFYFDTSASRLGGCDSSEDESVSDPVTPMTAHGSKHSASSTVHSHAASVLYYKFPNQLMPSGPISLQSEGTYIHMVETLPPGSDITTGSGSVVSIPLMVQVVKSRGGGCRVVLHSQVQLMNDTGKPLNIGMEFPFRLEPKWLQTLDPGCCMWLPAIRPMWSSLVVQPADMPGIYKWSSSFRLQNTGVEGDGSVVLAVQPRSVMCKPARAPFPPLAFNIAASPLPGGGAVLLMLAAPMSLQNLLPLPLTITLHGKGTTAIYSAPLEPFQTVKLHAADVSQVEAITLQPDGFHATRKITTPPATCSPAAPGYQGTPAVIRSYSSGSSNSKIWLQHLLDDISGSHTFKVLCNVWVYNCTAMMIAVKAVDQPVVEGTPVDIQHPWILPYSGNSWAPSGVSVGHRGAAVPHGFVDLIRRSGAGNRGRGSAAGDEDLAMSRLASYRGDGIGVDGNVEQAVSRVPSIYSGIMAEAGGKLHLQLRMASPMGAYGDSDWSKTFEVDPLGAAEVVTLHLKGKGGEDMEYSLFVTATQVPGGNGSVALYILPRYVLYNTLGVPLQCRQQGAQTETDIQPHSFKALTVSQPASPVRLSMRIQQAGWLWSGGVSIDVPGSHFVKLRHRDQKVETKLLRVDVVAAHNGTIVGSVAHQTGGFAPYRIDNCSSETLHLRQLRCVESEDVLRPYSSLLYTWDEPALPHRIILALPGNRPLGVFSLDTVGQQCLLTIPPNPRLGSPESTLHVEVRTEGPTYVLLIQDTSCHPEEAAIGSSSALEQGRELGWADWSDPAAVTGQLVPHLDGSEEGMPQADQVVHSGRLLELIVRLGGVGLSVVSATEEVLYAGVVGIVSRVTLSRAYATMELSCQHIQVDNPVHCAAYPVVVCCPSPLPLPVYPSGRSTRQKEVALLARLAVWRRKPGGVVCLERVEVGVAPIAISIEQQHIHKLIATVQSLAQPLLVSQEGTQRDRRHLTEAADVVSAVNQAVQLLHSEYVYVEYMSLGTFHALISFMPAPWQADGGPAGQPVFLQRLLSLVDLEDVHLRLAGLEMRWRLLGLPALLQHISRHYTWAVLQEVYKILGSVNLLGDPVRLFNHLGAGVWSFVVNPAAGLVQSAHSWDIGRLFEGMRLGAQGLVLNTVFAVSHATTKLSVAARKGLMVMGLERMDGMGVVGPQQRAELMASSSGAQDGIINAVLFGLVGLLSEPVRGAEEGGLHGLLKGTLRGVAGAVVRPVASLLETTAHITDSIRKAVSGGNHLAARQRPPRYIGLGEPLVPYDLLESLGRWLVHDVEGGVFRNERFTACYPLQPPSLYFVITHRHAFVAKVDQVGGFHYILQWLVSLDDIELVKKIKATVVLIVALTHGSVVVNRTAAHGGGLGGGQRKGRLPLDFAHLTCRDKETAERLRTSLRLAWRTAPQRMKIIYHIPVSSIAAA